MAPFRFFVAVVLSMALNLDVVVRGAELETYIVHVEMPGNQPVFGKILGNLDGWYRKFLAPMAKLSSSGEEPEMVYSYHNVFPGFAVKLSPEQAKEMGKIPGFVSARPQKTLALDTTHSTNFLGLSQNMGFWNQSNYGRGIIIGVLDSGIQPDHPSFSDVGMPPPPAKWRGSCNFNSIPSPCNNKLIGAKFFSVGSSPADDNGHGTHTASTAAGNFVPGANVYGNANGTAAGVAPLAHIAVYKVCQIRCAESDILAGMDAAISDGVDVLSLSLGGPASNFYEENVAVGAFSAIERGIFVSCSAGNSGPELSTVGNGAPWLLTVGASTTDRKLSATATLGTSEELHGESNFNPAGVQSTLLPLVYPGLHSFNPNASYCVPDSLTGFDLRGKIVLCHAGAADPISKGKAVRDAGGAGIIIVNGQAQAYYISLSSHVLPAVHLNYDDGQKIINYVSTAVAPTASISFRGTIIGDQSAPLVASFSSRGPNQPSPGILKPDIIGPGANILAAWHESIENNPNTKSNFNIISGTSMSCPHLSGVAALLKSTHPDWSPAAIKSAIMTTADLVNLAKTPIQDETLEPANVFATGSGHVNILKANDPGLVYDLAAADYIPYLCGLGYTDQQVTYIANRAVTCSTVTSITEGQLNYPSFVAAIGLSAVTYSRTVTNVGAANSAYTVEVVGLEGATVSVVPTTLQFTQVHEKLSYQVTFNRLPTTPSDLIVQGFLTWNSTTHAVRSPVVVAFL